MALYKRLGSVFGWTGAAAIAAALVMFTTAPARADVDFRVILGVPGTVGVFMAPDHYHRPPPHWRQHRYKRDYHHRQRWTDNRRGHRNDALTKVGSPGGGKFGQSLTKKYKSAH